MVIWWDEKYVIATRLHSSVSPGCSSAVALLIYHCLYNSDCKDIPCKSDNFVPSVAPRVTKDSVISVTADETSRCAASGGEVRQPASGNRLFPSGATIKSHMFTLMAQLLNF